MSLNISSYSKQPTKDVNTATEQSCWFGHKNFAAVLLHFCINLCFKLITRVVSRPRLCTGNTYAVQGSGLKKFVCWHLNHRGAVGETLLHVCFLSGLPDHMKLLAQRLLYNFPKIINDFYLCDEYYGMQFY